MLPAETSPKEFTLSVMNPLGPAASLPEGRAVPVLQKLNCKTLAVGWSIVPHTKKLLF